MGRLSGRPGRHHEAPPRLSANRLEAAARHYGEAFRYYDLYLVETQRCNSPRPTFAERARAPERIAASAPHLERGIEEEALGLEALEEAVEELDRLRPLELGAE